MGNPTPKTETQTSTLPAWVTQAQQQNLGIGQNLTSNFTGNAPNFGVAGLNTDQLLAGDLLRKLTASQFTQGGIPAYDVMGMGKNWQNQTSAPGAMAAQLKPGDIQPFMNPFISASLNPTLDKLKQTYGDTQAKIGGDAAAAHMFGGSREAVQRSLLNRDYLNTTAKTTGDMMAAGFDKASGLASGNTDRQQQANMENARFGEAQNNRLFQSDQNDASRFLESLRVQNGLNNDELNRKLQSLVALSGFGGQVQGTQQKALDQPFKALQMLLASMPTQTDVTKTGTTENATNGWMTGLGGLLALGGLGTGGGSTLGGSLLMPLLGCDRDLKTDIEHVGTNAETGLPEYTYRYKGDTPDVPKMRGPMAQDVEARYPHAVRRVGGRLMIDQGQLLASIRKAA